MPSVRIPAPEPYNLGLTLASFRRGTGDPTMRMGAGGVWRATRTPDGTATIHIARDRDGDVRVEAWGAGADRALDAAPALLGFHDRPEDLRLDEPRMRRLQAQLAGLRLPRSGAVMEALVPAILEQKVTGTEAWRAWRSLARRYGEPAPGPGAELGLRIPPPPSTLAELPSWAYHPHGVERRRAETIIRACRDAARLERLVDGPVEVAYARLRSIPGIGPWTAAEVGLRAFGDTDAVTVGDFHLPHLVSWALAGEPRGTDERMLELLAPYAGQRGRVVRLLELSGISAPRYGPRLSPRSIAGF